MEIFSGLTEINGFVGHRSTSLAYSNKVLLVPVNWCWTNVLRDWEKVQPLNLSPFSPPVLVNMGLSLHAVNFAISEDDLGSQRRDTSFIFAHIGGVQF